MLRFVICLYPLGMTKGIEISSWVNLIHWGRMTHMCVSTWWRHQMETFFALLAICAGNSSAPGEFPTQRPATRSFDVFLINGWVNNRDAGDLTRYRAHYDVTVMKLTIIGSESGLSPGRRQAIIWTNAGILLIGPLGTNVKWNFNRNSYIFIQENPFENVF